jgi:hypothetical protein
MYEWYTLKRDRYELNGGASEFFWGRHLGGVCVLSALHTQKNTSFKTNIKG